MARIPVHSEYAKRCLYRFGEKPPKSESKCKDVSHNSEWCNRQRIARQRAEELREELEFNKTWS